MKILSLVEHCKELPGQEQIESRENYCVKVTKVVKFGFFVEFFPGKEILCHISVLNHPHPDVQEGSLQLTKEEYGKIQDLAQEMFGAEFKSDRAPLAVN